MEIPKTRINTNISIKNKERINKLKENSTNDFGISLNINDIIDIALLIFFKQLNNSKDKGNFILMASQEVCSDGLDKYLKE